MNIKNLKKLINNIIRKESQLLDSALSEFFDTDISLHLKEIKPGSVLIQALPCTLDQFSDIPGHLQKNVAQYHEGKREFLRTGFMIRSDIHSLAPMVKYCSVLTGEYTSDQTMRLRLDITDISLFEGGVWTYNTVSQLMDAVT